MGELSTRSFLRPVIAAADVHIRPAVRGDALEVCGLLHRLELNVPSSDHAEACERHWDRLWDKNPYFEVFPGPVKYGWVMEHAGRIRGFFGCIPRVYVNEGRSIPVAIASQWGVEKEYRAHTTMLCDAFFNDDSFTTRLVTTAIKPTGRIFERYGGAAMPDPSLMLVYMVPLRPEELIMHKLGPKARFLRPLIKLATAPLRWRTSRIKKDHRVREVPASDPPETMDEFWRRHIAGTNGMRASRARPFLRWYLATGSRGLKKRMVVLEENGEVNAYAAFMEEPVPGSSIKRYKIIDLLVLDERMKRTMIRALTRLAYAEGADVLELHLPGMIGKRAIDGYLAVRHVPQFPVYYHTTDPEVARTIDSRGWRISPFDGDAALA